MPRQPPQAAAPTPRRRRPSSSSPRSARSSCAARIRVNCIAPGFIATEASNEMIAAGKLDGAGIERRTPLGRLGDPGRRHPGSAVPALRGEHVHHGRDDPGRRRLAPPRRGLTVPASANHARAAARGEPFDLGERRHRRVARRRHRERAVRRRRSASARSSVEPLEEAVEEAGGERVAAADPVEDLELRARRSPRERRLRAADARPSRSRVAVRAARSVAASERQVRIGGRAPRRACRGRRAESRSRSASRRRPRARSRGR